MRLYGDSCLGSRHTNCTASFVSAHLLLSAGCVARLAPVAGFPLPLLLAPLPFTAAPSSLNCLAPSPVKEGACMMGDPNLGSRLASQPTLLAATQFSPARMPQWSEHQLHHVPLMSKADCSELDADNKHECMSLYMCMPPDDPSREGRSDRFCHGVYEY